MEMRQWAARQARNAARDEALENPPLPGSMPELDDSAEARMVLSVLDPMSTMASVQPTLLPCDPQPLVTPCNPL